MAYSRPFRQTEESQFQPMVSRPPKMIYAPPEFFMKFQNHHPLKPVDFDELLAGDVYSMALLFWEICNKGMFLKSSLINFNFTYEIILYIVLLFNTRKFKI